MPPKDKKKKVTNQQTSSSIQQSLSNQGVSFRKSDEKKYPYLGSRFSFDQNVFNPMRSTGQRRNTHYDDAKYNQDKSLRNYFGGNAKAKKAAEKGAKRAANISSNLNKSLYQASKLLAQGKESEADNLAFEASSKAFAEQRKGGFGANVVSAANWRNIQNQKNSYYSPRIRQQAKNMTEGIKMSGSKITAPDAKEINASLRSLTSMKKK